MITRSTIDGWLKNPEKRKLLAIIGLMISFAVPFFILIDLLDWSVQQTREAVRRETYWHGESVKWRDFALQSGLNVTSTSRCDAEKCVNICTGAPAMEPRP